jgi:class 3 adenylate cyclase/tetratricopeptide (TPR) repeat protein
MAVCPNCGTESPDTFKFCPSCATPLDQAPQPQAEERKVVSVVFVDLVGFTARSHDLDPEDVRAALAPYHHLLKREIEGFGGTVEKFIGDAVMAVFGAPVAHEDDAERAVRAALRITEAIEEFNAEAHLDLSIRAAVNTGEGLVSLYARPQAGEGMVTGDVVNTTSRLQGVAPVNGVVVGEITYRSTKDFIVYEEMEPVSVKGKPGPVQVWRAVSARSRFGVDLETNHTTPFIGRDLDLTTLKTSYQRALRESSLQLVTIVGEPGVGKSRLLAEFASYLDEQEEIVLWRQGRSLPYGEGITFWALGEIVKAQAGINESDSPDVAAEKLVSATTAVVADESDRAWLQARLAPLVGATTVSGRGAEKEESFTAWLRFLEAIATTRPLVLVFEDLHWADAAMLEFLDHLVEWSTGVPLLVVCTARPELYESHQGWGGGKRNSTTISLSPLSDSETAQLISALMAQAVLPAEVHTALLERAGGNPLYAEEFIRMLSDRGILQRRGRLLTVDSEADITMPDNIQALIAARLDTLSAERKALLHDAAVTGKVFWSGAVAALGGRDDREVREGLHELARKELVRPARNSSIEGQQEYSFWHSLVRDVAYGQIPRAARGRKHQALAAWLEDIAGDRVSDVAELMVHHYSEALELARAAGDDASVGELIEPARRFLILAGDRAFELEMSKAGSYYERALELLPPLHPERASTLVKLGHVTLFAGRNDDAERHFEEGLVEARRGDDTTTQADAALGLATAAWIRGESERNKELYLTAIELLEPKGPGRKLIEAYATAALHSVIAGRPAEGLNWSEKALAIAAGVGGAKESLQALIARGGARCDVGDLRGIDDLRAAAEEVMKLGLGRETMVAHSWFAEESWLIEGAMQGVRIYEDASDFAVRRGAAGFAMLHKAESLRALFDLGEWNKVVALSGEVLSWSKAHGDIQTEATALPILTQVLSYREGHMEAATRRDRLLELGRQIQDLQVFVPSLAVSALIDQGRGSTEQAVDLIDELDRATRDNIPLRARYLPSVVRVLIWAAKVTQAAHFMKGLEAVALRDRNCLTTGRALVAEALHEPDTAAKLYEDASQRWAEYGFVLEEGQAHLGLARCLIALGDREAATEPLQKARVLFERLGAKPLLNEVNGFLGEARAV